MKAVQKQWLEKAVGQKINPDLAFGLQCPDPVDAYAEAIFGVDWRVCVGGVNGARELFAKAPDKYWEKIKNDPNKPDQLPEDGDVLVYGGSVSNEFGHTCINRKASKDGPYVLQQDGFAPPLVWVPVSPGSTKGNWYSDKPAHMAQLGWYMDGTGWITGWLRPRPEMVIDVDKESPVVTAEYEFITKYDFPAHTPKARVKATFGVDRPALPVSDVIHWWGEPRNKPTFESTCRYLVNQPPTGVSSHYVLEAGRVACGVAEADASHANGHAAANAMTVTWECNPRMSKEDVETLIDALTDAWINRGMTKPGLIEEHNDYFNTQCAGTYTTLLLQPLANVAFAVKLAAKKGEPLPEKPKPVPVAKPKPVVAPAPKFVLDPHWRVEPNDTLSGIAPWAGVTWQRLAAFNRIPAPYRIEVGETIWAPRDGLETWIVRKGETLSAIAAGYQKAGFKGVTVEKLQNANGINDVKKDVKPGMRLLVKN